MGVAGQRIEVHQVLEVGQLVMDPTLSLAYQAGRHDQLGSRRRSVVRPGGGHQQLRFFVSVGHRRVLFIGSQQLGQVQLRYRRIQCVRLLFSARSQTPNSYWSSKNIFLK